MFIPTEKSLVLSYTGAGMSSIRGQCIVRTRSHSSKVGCPTCGGGVQCARAHHLTAAWGATTALFNWNKQFF